MSEPGTVKQVKINEATVSLRKDGIVHILFHRNVTLDLPLQMLLLNIYNEVTERKKHPFLFEALSGVRVTKEAKENALRIEPEVPGSAYAIVAETVVYRLIAGFYLGIKKPKSPYKVFSDKADAIRWLQSYVTA